jgi:hypothetical protein
MSEDKKIKGRLRRSPEPSPNLFVIHKDEAGSLSIRVLDGAGDKYLYLEDGEDLSYGLGTVEDFKAVMDEFWKFAEDNEPDEQIWTPGGGSFTTR